MPQPYYHALRNNTRVRCKAAHAANNIGYEPVVTEMQFKVKVALFV